MAKPSNQVKTMSFFPRISGAAQSFVQARQHFGRQSILAKYSLAKSPTVARMAQRVAGVESRVLDLHSTQRPSSRLFSSADVTPDTLKLLTPEELTTENTDYHKWFVVSSRNDKTFDTRTAENLTLRDLSSGDAVLFFNGSFTNFQSKTNPEEPPSAKTELESIHKLVGAKTAILLYSRLFPVEKKLQSTDEHFEKSHTIFDEILKLDSAFLDKQYLPTSRQRNG
jgi:hypothetical protein